VQDAEEDEPPPKSLPIELVPGGKVGSASTSEVLRVLDAVLVRCHVCWCKVMRQSIGSSSCTAAGDSKPNQVQI